MAEGFEKVGFAGRIGYVSGGVGSHLVSFSSQSQGLSYS